MNKEYLYRWIQENYETLCDSEWYEGCFDGETMESIEVDFFIRTYLIPLVESNIQYDFDNIEIDGESLFNMN